MSKPKVIAFYLPQYHPTPDNDRWWGKGFTEWTNVGKAKPLFRGHYQPKVPADLGYYDLRLPEVREAQAELAKEAGIYGFCYYHYWFGNGKEELELPFNEVLRLGKPDFPFMLCWANESWHKKFWNKDGKGSSKEMLIEQTYPGEQDIIDHFYRLLPAFKDPRYIRIDGKPAFMIYTPDELPNPHRFIEIWESLAKANDLNGIYFICQLRDDLYDNHFNSIMSQGFNRINTVRLWDAWNKNYNFFNRLSRRFKRHILRRPQIRNFESFYKYLISEKDIENNIIPTLIPNWDHTPRSGFSGTAITNATPNLFGKQIDLVLDLFEKYKRNDALVFLKSWNEWGEGNYLEPDLKYEHGFLDIVKQKLKSI